MTEQEYKERMRKLSYELNPSVLICGRDRYRLKYNFDCAYVGECTSLDSGTREYRISPHISAEMIELYISHNTVGSL